MATIKPLSVLCLALLAISTAQFSRGFGALSAPSRPEEGFSARVDDAVAAEMRERHIPGLALTVIRDGQVIKAQGYGLANIELSVAAKPETIFQTGSVGKQFTAMAVVMLAEEGKIQLDDKISKYFSEAPESWKKITVRNLLTHTSGISDYGSEKDGLGKNLIDLRADYTEEQLVQKFAGAALDFSPGEKWSYSNSGYVILGVLIHRVTGQFYGDVLQQRIFRPLGMSATRIISEADIVPNRSAGYLLIKGEIKNQSWVSPTLNTTADGALYTTVLDMAKWDAALYGNTLLRKSSFEEMWSPVHLRDGKTYPYGFGWRVRDVHGHHLLEHSGSWQGFSTHIARYVNDKLSFVVLTNLDEEHAQPSRIAHRLAAIYVPEVAEK